MTAAAPPLWTYPRVVRRLAATRGVEVGVLQASPVLGAWLGGLELDARGATRLGLLLVGSLALTAHAFVVNDWAGYRSDALDARHASGAGISRDQIGRVATVLLLVAGVTLAAVSKTALLLGAGITALSLVYSLAPRLGKSTPVAASLNHVAGGALHFLLGYTLVHRLDAKGVAVSLFFGLVFAAGHLVQEVRDYESDRANGISTSAVVFGCRPAFLTSFCLFTSAYALISGLAAAGVLPRVLLVTALAWLLHLWWSSQALRRGLEMETALWMQRRYRLLCSLVGLAMLIR